MKSIEIRGARIHNLKNINLSIPKDKLIVVSGVSGSGKSSLVFDIIFEEGKKQYLQWRIKCGRERPDSAAGAGWSFPVPAAQPRDAWQYG